MSYLSVQIKVASPDEAAFDYLYLIALDIDFKPVDFYDSIKQKTVGKKQEWKIEWAFMKGKSVGGKVSKGSDTYLNFETNLIDKLLEAIR